MERLECQICQYFFNPHSLTKSMTCSVLPWFLWSRKSFYGPSCSILQVMVDWMLRSGRVQYVGRLLVKSHLDYHHSIWHCDLLRRRKCHLIWSWHCNLVTPTCSMTDIFKIKYNLINSVESAFNVKTDFTNYPLLVSLSVPFCRCWSLRWMPPLVSWAE